MVKSAEVKEYKQKIYEDVGKELAVSPEHIRNYSTTNIFQRAFSYLFGWSVENKPIKLLATRTGSLKVAYTGAGLEKAERIEGIAKKDTTEFYTFTEPVNQVLIKPDKYDIYFQSSPTGRYFYDVIRCYGGNVFELNLIVKKFGVKAAGNYEGNFEVAGLR